MINCAHLPPCKLKPLLVPFSERPWLCFGEETKQDVSLTPLTLTGTLILTLTQTASISFTLTLTLTLILTLTLTFAVIFTLIIILALALNPHGFLNCGQVLPCSRRFQFQFHAFTPSRPFLAASRFLPRSRPRPLARSYARSPACAPLQASSRCFSTEKKTASVGVPRVQRNWCRMNVTAWKLKALLLVLSPETSFVPACCPSERRGDRTPWSSRLILTNCTTSSAG